MNYYKVPEELLYSNDIFIKIDNFQESSLQIGSIFGCQIFASGPWLLFKSEEDFSGLLPEIEKFKVSELEYMAEML